LTLVYIILIVSMILYVTINLDNLLFDIIFLAIMGLFTLPIYPSFYSELSFFMNKKRMGLSYGMLMGIGWSGGFVSSLIAGYLADMFGYQMYIITSIIFASIALIIVQLIPKRIVKK
jgi:MFS family permease